MKNLVLFLLFLFFVPNVFSQTFEWDVLKTDDGEFSMKMPAGCYSQLYIPEGITLQERNDGYRYSLKEMRLITCYDGETLMSAEIYKTGAAQKIINLLKDRFRLEGTESPLEKPFYGVEQTNNNQDFSLTRRIIAGKKHIYIITTARRGAPDETMNTFLQSLKFAPTAPDVVPTNANEKVVLISSVKNVVPEVVTESDERPETDVPAPSVPVKSEETPIREKLIILHKTPAAYTFAARKNKVRGIIRLRLNFGADGKINKIKVVRSLPNGLLREAVLAALRMKFLPEEETGDPRSVTKLVEYNFNLY